MYKSKAGFTLIELMVVITIIAILSSLVLTSLANAQTRARNASAKGKITEGGTAINTFLITYEHVLAVDTTDSSPSLGAGQFGGGSMLTGNVVDNYSKAAMAFLYLFAVDTPVPGNSVLVIPAGDHHYAVNLSKTPSLNYTFDYRTADQQNYVSCNETAIQCHAYSQSVPPRFTLITNLDTRDGSSDAYYWVNEKSSGSGAASAIPAP